MEKNNELGVAGARCHAPPRGFALAKTPSKKGSFAFEFMRRCEGEKAEAFNHWNTKRLHEQFSDSIENKKLIIPLLHRSISMGHFLSCHEIFSDNGDYFEYVSKLLSKRMIDIIKLID